MTIEFPGLGAPQNVANAEPTQQIFYSAGHASTIMSQGGKSEDGSFFTSVWDCITFFPRKIWGFIQMLFCCKSGQLSFADQLLKDPKAAAKRTIEIVEEKGFEEGIKSLEKGMANLYLIPANKEAFGKTRAWADEIRKLAPNSTNDEVKASLVQAMQDLGKDLEFCRKISKRVRQNPKDAAQKTMKLLEKGYDRGKVLLKRGFAAVDPKTPEGIAWAKENGKQFEVFAGALRAIVDGWGNSNLTPDQQESKGKLPGDLEEIMKPFLAAMTADQQ